MLNPRKLSQDPAFKNLLLRDKFVLLRSPLDELDPAQRNGTASLETVAAALAKFISANYATLSLLAAQSFAAAGDVLPNTLYAITSDDWNAAGTDTTVFVQGVRPDAYHRLGVVYDAQGASQLVEVDVAAGTYEKLAAYDDKALRSLLRLTTDANPAAPVNSIPTAAWGLQQVGTVFSLLRDATQIPLPAGTRNTFLLPTTGEASTSTRPVNATASPYLGVKGGGALTFSKPVAQTCFYDKDLRFVSSAGTISQSVVAPATAYYVRVVALTDDGPDTGRTGVSSVYSTVTYSLDELPYVTGIQLPGGNIVRPNAVGVVDGSQLGSGSPGGTPVPFGPLTATGAAGETFPLPAGTQSVRGVQVFDVSPGPGQYPVVGLTSNMYTLDTSAVPPTLSVLAPYTLSVNDTIEGFALMVASASGGGTPAKPRMLLFHDNSLGAFYYLANGTWVKPSPSFIGTPNAQQFSGKIADLVQGGVKVVNNSYPGFNIFDATTDGPAPSNPAVNVVADARAVIQANPDRDIDLVAGFLENGFDLYTLAQMKARWDAYNTFYKNEGVKRIFHRVPVTRAGTYSNTVDGDITSNILAMRAYMRQQAAASGGTIIIAADADGPNITASNYPQNAQFCNQNDGGMFVHYSEFAVTEQANELIKTLSLYGYAFPGLATSVGSGGVAPAGGAYVAYTLGGGMTQDAAAHQLTATSGADWGNIAMGTKNVTGDAKLDVSAPIPQDPGAFIFGFTAPGNTAVGFADILFGWYLDGGGGWGIIENGLFAAGYQTDGALPLFTGTNKLAVVRENGVLRYFLNGQPYYTTKKSIPTILRPKVALDKVGVTFSGLLLTAANTSPA